MIVNAAAIPFVEVFSVQIPEGVVGNAAIKTFLMASSVYLVEDLNDPNLVTLEDWQQLGSSVAFSVDQYNRTWVAEDRINLPNYKTEKTDALTLLYPNDVRLADRITLINSELTLSGVYSVYTTAVADLATEAPTTYTLESAREFRKRELFDIYDTEMAKLNIKYPDNERFGFATKADQARIWLGLTAPEKSSSIATNLYPMLFSEAAFDTHPLTDTPADILKTDNLALAILTNSREFETVHGRLTGYKNYYEYLIDIQPDAASVLAIIFMIPTYEDIVNTL